MTERDYRQDEQPRELTPEERREFTGTTFTGEGTEDIPQEPRMRVFYGGNWQQLPQRYIWALIGGVALFIFAVLGGVFLFFALFLRLFTHLG